MNLKVFFVSLLLMSVFGVIFVSAQTMTDAQKQVLITQLQQQIVQLQQQLLQLIAQQGTSSNAWCNNFNTDLNTTKSGNSEVAYLHIALQKEGISYGSDGTNIYSSGTSNAVKQFQARYQISQTGNVGPYTRAKLNDLYGCLSTTNTTIQNLNNCQAECLNQAGDVYAIGCSGSILKCQSGQICEKTYSSSYKNVSGKIQVIKNLTGSQCKVSTLSCIPSWQQGPWSTCTSNIKTRSVTDSKNCGSNYNKPVERQSCTAKAVDLQIDGSDGPVNLFVTLGNGATVNSDGNITLSKEINLSWSGVGVSSCSASDSLTPKIFSGYQPASGSKTLTLSGIIKVSSSTSTFLSTSNRIMDTFKVSCVSSTTGSQIYDTITVNLYYTANSACSPDWQCDVAWSVCANGKQSRKCVDRNGCGSVVNMPSISQSCTCSPSWHEEPWGVCENGRQSRVVTDTNGCGTTTGKPSISQSCCAATCLNQTTGTAPGVYAISCSGTPTKCSSKQECRLTYSTTYDYNNANSNSAVETITTLTGAQCKCIPVWQMSDWGTCNTTTNKETRTVTDVNSCSDNTDKPETTRDCGSAPAPVIAPSAGYYSGVQTIVITDTLSGASIYYTIDGSTPTTSSTLYTGPFTLNNSATVKAIATKVAYTTSSVASATYNYTALQLPTFSPVAGTYSGARTITISHSVSGTSIYYTIDGSTPTTSSTLYTGPFTLNSSATVKAIATKAGNSNSSVASATYTYTALQTPILSPIGGTYNAAQTITISHTVADVNIYYTIDGSTPTTSSIHYAAPFVLNYPATVKAIATKVGYANSSVASVAYNYVSLQLPTFSPVGGTYSGERTITISHTVADVNIYYTIDGSTPTTSSIHYAAPFVLNYPATVKAIATKTGYANSLVASAVYAYSTLQQPTFSPGGGTYTGEKTITISHTVADVNIYYTIDGSTPTTSSTLYTGPFTLNSSATVKAIATKAGYTNSASISNIYTLVASTPVITPSAGSYNGEQIISISDTLSGVIIRYTTNGSTPTTTSTIYSQPFTISPTAGSLSTNVTVKAIATKTGFTNSSVATNIYTLTAP